MSAELLFVTKSQLKANKEMRDGVKKAEQTKDTMNAKREEKSNQMKDDLLSH